MERKDYAMHFVSFFLIGMLYVGCVGEWANRNNDDYQRNLVVQQLRVELEEADGELARLNSTLMEYTSRCLEMDARVRTNNANIGPLTRAIERHSGTISALVNAGGEQQEKIEEIRKTLHTLWMEFYKDKTARSWKDIHKNMDSMIETLKKRGDMPREIQEKANSFAGFSVGKKVKMVSIEEVDGDTMRVNIDFEDGSGYRFLVDLDAVQFEKKWEKENE